MKKKLFLFILLTSITVFAQQKTFTLNWQASQTISGGSYSIEIPSFNEEVCDFDFDLGLAVCFSMGSCSSVNEESVAISKVSYANIS